MAFIASLENIAKSFKLRHDKPVIDNYIFQCHYKLTTNILFFFGLLLTSINLKKGNPIECFTDVWKEKSEIVKALTTFCWTSNLYTKKEINGKKIFHSYYKWVPFMLFFQAISFYVPHLIWKMWEGRKIQMITKNIRGFNMDTAEERQTKQNQLVYYFIGSFHSHNIYAFGYIMSEIINIINIIGNIYITNKFLGHTFLSYGIEVFKTFQNGSYKWENSTIEIIFPRQVKCDFYKFGPSGSIENKDIYCLLPQNVLNGKMYLFLWVWFFIIASISILALVYRVAIIIQILVKKPLLLKIFSFTNNKQTILRLISKFQVGDVLLLRLIEKNVNSIQFEEIVEEICSGLNVKHNKKYTQINNTLL